MVQIQMNERINELLKQSRTEYWTQYTPSYDYEKFAELIVRECLTFVEPMPGSGDIDDLALEAAREQILEHFGVTE
jgi:hypothetical protein